ncbi:hypothetical protein NEOC84_001509|nr:hypothetical protein [Neochlamydia sp. AcF95]NGY95588.1 hypothetical protein [Neochlamydia sp. AcF84]
MGSLGCQKVTAKYVSNQGGYYLLAVRGNRGNLHAKTENIFDQAIKVTPKKTSDDYDSI